MSQLETCSLPGAAIYGTSTRRSLGSQFQQPKSVRCQATQTQSVQKKSSSATVGRDKKGKVQGPKLDDGSGGFPPFRFGKGGVGGFLLFSCVLLLDYLKEFEKYLLTRRHRAGDAASNGLLQS